MSPHSGSKGNRDEINMKPAQNTEKEKYLKIIFKNMVDNGYQRSENRDFNLRLRNDQKKKPEERINRNKDITEENFFKTRDLNM